MHIIDSLLQQAVSKIIVDKSKIPRGAYDAVRPLIREIQSWTEIFDDLDPTKPNTYVHAGWQLLDRVVEPPKSKIDPLWAYLQKADYLYEIPTVLEDLFHFALNHLEMEKVTDVANKSIWRINIGDHKMLAVGPQDAEEKEDVKYDFYLRPVEKVIQEIYKHVGDIFWKSQSKSIVLDFSDGDFSISQYKFTDREYKGEVLEYVKNLQRYADCGVRRVVILQGVPGTGKSTLCAHASRILSERTLVLTTDFVTEIPRSDWAILLEVLDPEMVIVDDIDRMGSRQAEMSLYMFEDAFYHVPITLMTTNDQAKLPAAFRRPGRVDQIIDMPPPGDDIIEEVVRSIGEMEDMTEIPDDKIPFLVEVCKEYPGAHLVELFRRYKVEGWDYVLPENDIAFRDLKRSQLADMLKNEGHQI